MADISDLPMLHDIDADYSPQYVKLARILRDKIEAGGYQPGDILPAADLARQYEVSVRVTCAALAMLGGEPVYQSCRGLHLIPGHLAGAAH